MVLYFSDIFSLSICKDVNLLFFFLKFLIYPLIPGNTKTNGLITSFKCKIKYLELFFLSINFETTILLISTSQVLIVFLHDKTLFVLLLSHRINIILSKNFVFITFSVFTLLVCQCLFVLSYVLLIERK